MSVDTLYTQKSESTLNRTPPKLQVRMKKYDDNLANTVYDPPGV